MYKDQPLSLKLLLPGWISPEMFTVGVAGVVAAGGLWVVLRKFGPRGRMTARIETIQARRAELRGEFLDSKRRRRKHTLESEASLGFMRRVAERLQLVKNLQVGQAEKLLIEAGYHSRDAVQIMSFFVMALPIVLCIAGLVAMKLNAGGTGKWHMIHYLWPVLGAYIGLKAPWIFVQRKRARRYYAIQKSLADVMDLMTICAEAGLSLAVMLDRVSKELLISYPEMAEELALTSIEIGFLPDRNKALSNLAERVTLPEVRGMVSVLIQTEKYGTPIAQALRVLSSEFRQSRMLRAEQKAAKLPALMTVPMICFILPTLFIVIIAPAVVKLMDTMGNMPK